MTTNKYIIMHGKHGRLEDVAGVQTLVTRKPGDIIELTLLQAQDRQQSIRLATDAEIAAYEARLRGETEPPPPIPNTHVSTAGAPPTPTPAVDPLQPPATAEHPPARHFPEPAAPAAIPPAPPVAPVEQHVVPPVAAPTATSAPAVPPAQRASDSASAKAENEGKPKARTSAKKTKSRGGRK